MKEWYSFTPQDTLYFRGAEPANMGESHTASMIFPPPAHTIAGALRTAVLVENGVSLSDYNADRCTNEIFESIGKSGGNSPFEVIGPLFAVGGDLWVPCPFIWYYAKDERKKNGPYRKLKVVVSAPVNNRSLLKTESGERLFWAKGNNLESLGGAWVRAEELCGTSSEKNIRFNGDFFVSEIHTGIALDVKNKRRTAREGHLYAFVHARLLPGVNLIFGVTKELPLKQKGALKLGAEQRFGKYNKIDNVLAPQGSSGLFMSLTILPGDKKANRNCVATDRIQYYGGWDMHKNFHKNMQGYFSRGSVFNEKINDNFIEL